MKEQFKILKPQGTISITLDKDTGRMWEADKAVILSAIISICEDYQSQGYSLTLRQLYYQLVSKDLIPNHDKVYKKLSSLKDEVVYSGMVDWSIFEDRGRIPQRSYFEHSIKGALERTVASYALNKQIGQPNHIEVWTEKDAISDILSRVTRPNTIHLVVNKGYSSSTAMYGAYQRFMRAIEAGKKIVILYFGDHDPSGLDMIRDIKDRILFFMNNGSVREDLHDLMYDWAYPDGNMTDECDEYRDDQDCYCVEPNSDDGEEHFDHELAFIKHHFRVRPIGLTMEQIEEYKPPHNPAKITDPRAKDYVKKFGQKSWEVDALKPAVMTEIVRSAIKEETDIDIQNNVFAKQETDQKKITKIIDNLKD